MRDKTFVKITNSDIFEKLKCIEKNQIELAKNQAIMVEHQKTINGKVRFHTKLIAGLAGAMLTAFLAMVGWIMKIN
jgi:hypothetical protein